MPILNVLKSMQGFGDLTYCGHVIMGCDLRSSVGNRGVCN